MNDRDIDLDATGDLANEQIERERRKLFGRHGDDGGARIRTYDPRVSKLRDWLIASFGGLGILIGVGVYHKLSDMNDTMIRAVAKIDTQGIQISDLRNEMSKQRDEIASLRAQVYTLEGRTLRGIAEASRVR